MYDDIQPWWRIVRYGTFRFYWFPGVRMGVYRMYHDGWHLTINMGFCSLSWWW